MQDFKQFEVEYDDTAFICEFDFDSIRAADENAIMGITDKPMAFSANVFYFSTLKHHPHSNKNKVLDFAYKIFEDPEYGIHAFDEIVEDFIENFTKYAERKGRKTFTATKSKKVLNIPKAEK